MGFELLPELRSGDEEMRLIDADALKKTLEKLWNIHDDQDFANKDVWREIENAPTIEMHRTAKVFMELRCVDGIAYQQHICSSCDKSLDIPEVGKSPDWKPKYCKNCGAKLDWGKG